MLRTEEDIPILTYEIDNFNFSVSENDNDSVLDGTLKEKWQKAEKDGLLRYTVDINNWRILNGRYQLLAQLNPNRAFNRRTPEFISSMVQPLNPNHFNFTKLPRGEILFKLGNNDENDIVAVNVSPIEWGHSLLLVQYLKCLPQRLTQYSLEKAIELLLLSNSPHLRMAYNSRCAFASVNHLHWHLYYLKHKMLLEHINLCSFCDPLFVLEDFVNKGFCLKLSSVKNIESLVYWSFLIVDYLEQQQIAHNVYITRAKTSFTDTRYTDIRIYIWARKSYVDVKKYANLFNPAVCELFGHLSIQTREGYDNLTEEIAAEILNDVTDEIFLSTKSKLQKVIMDEKTKHSSIQK